MDLDIAWREWQTAQAAKRATYRVVALLGLPPNAPLKLQTGFALPAYLEVAWGEDLASQVQHRRLDLLALEQGYAGQEETVRAAILAQFPKIGLSGNRASVTSNVHTMGFGITFDLPLFDRNQVRRSRRSRSCTGDFTPGRSNHTIG